MQRREFLKGFIRWAFNILGVGTFVSSVIYLYPREMKKMEIRYFHALELNEIPKKGVKKILLTYSAGNGMKEARVFLAVSPQGLIAFSSRCSHLGCLVDWDWKKEQFLCPCHGGRFDINGNVIDGPPPAPLSRLPVEIREGKVLVGIKV